MARLTAAAISTVVLAAADTPPVVHASPPLFGFHTQADTYEGHSAAYWHWRFTGRTRQLRARTRQLVAVRGRLRAHWKPTVGYALRLASAVTGVPWAELNAVSWCESTHNPFAVNPSGRYRGLFQLSWAPFGFSPFDPVASALSAAMTVRHDGGWRQWECKP